MFSLCMYIYLGLKFKEIEISSHGYDSLKKTSEINSRSVFSERFFVLFSRFL